MSALRNLVAGLLAAAALGACAHAYPPPGGDPDRLPPGLVTTSPAPLSVQPALNEPVVFRFDERLRTRTFNRTLVRVMPAGPDEIVAELHGNELQVRLKNGWKPGQIYHVLLRPGLEDLFNNKRTDPIELIFSTGPQIPATALAGLIQERVTGRPATEALLEAVRRTDSVVYRTWADSAAFFVLRNVPYGAYDLTAFADRNRNGKLDAGEPRAPRVVASMGPGQDTVQVYFDLLPHDTTPARVTRAELADSLHLRLTFDDFIPPDSGLAAATVGIYQLPDSTLVPGSITLTLGAAPTAARPVVRDSAARRDSVARRDSAAARPARPAPTPARTQARAPLPEHGATITLSAPLAPGQYAIVVRNVRNVNGLVGNSSTRLQVRPPAARPGTTPGDTTATPPPGALPPWPTRRP